MSIESVMPSNPLILCHPLQYFPASGSFPMSQLFASGGQSWCWSFSFSISPSNEYSGLISLKNWLVWFPCSPGTLKSLLQHHSSKASILRCSAFYIVQLSHTYMTTGKTIALTRWTFVGKVISLLFNMLSRLAITFLPRSKSFNFFFFNFFAIDRFFLQFSSVAQSCPTLCDPMNRSTPGLPEFTQTHVHWVGDAIQPSHPLSSPSPPAPNPSQHQSLFQWVNSSHEVAKVLEFQL